MFGRLLCAGVLFTTLASQAAAAEPAARNANVPDATLAAMGLGGMESLSDQQGTRVRGGAAYAFSFSRAVGGVVSYNPPPSVSTTNPAFASSFAFSVGPGFVSSSRGFSYASGR